MFFNSIDFALFLPLVFTLYWWVVRHYPRLSNLVIVAASYVFYGWWDWRFLSLIFFSTLLDYSMALFIEREENPSRRKILIGTSVCVNLGLLAFFKYFHFFADNFVTAFSFFGGEINPGSLNIILPVGISFYTFQTMSYTLDVYHRKLKATPDFIAFSAFVSFFPQLVAGPIERAGHLLPQFYTPRRFDYAQAVNGMRQILWGLFKKIVIADNCAELANDIFQNSDTYPGSALVLGALFFSFQIYGDFSGYSDIAIGTARLFGFELMRNFHFPYFSRDIAEFWRRWHISLSTWFRDYLYIPMGGSRAGAWKNIRNVMVVFLVSGFWHGANWTFVIWGALHALYFLPVLIGEQNRRHMETVAKGKLVPGFGDLLRMGTTFCLVAFGWIFFRAENISHALNYVSGIFSPTLFAPPQIAQADKAFMTSVFILLFMVSEWLGREGEYALTNLDGIKRRSWRWMCYALILLCIYFFGNQGELVEFIYFQF